MEPAAPVAKSTHLWQRRNCERSPWVPNILQRKCKFMKHREVAVQFFPGGVSNLKKCNVGGYTLQTETNSNYNNFIKIIMIQCETPVIINLDTFSRACVSVTELVFHIKNLLENKEWNCSFLGTNLSRKCAWFKKGWLAFWRLIDSLSLRLVVNLFI